jgi:hypothetical protein
MEHSKIGEIVLYERNANRFLFAPLESFLEGRLPEELEYLSPEPLLKTSGSTWDFQASDDLKEPLRTTVTRYYEDYLERRLEKSTTPLFFMIAGAGEGKSRSANELPSILREEFASHAELKSRFKNALVFNISFENGTKLDPLQEDSAESAISKRMLFQLNKYRGGWMEARRTYPDISPDHVLSKIAKHRKVQPKSLTVIIVIDGMQAAIRNENDGRDKSSLFYSCMTVLNNFATSGPFVIACCTATLSRPFHVFVSSSHQKRVFLPISPLSPPQRQGKPVFANSNLVNMLINDMGGHGRALEALDEALRDKDVDNINFLTIAEGIRAKLSDLYGEWISQTSYLKPVLRVILTQARVRANEIVPGTDLKPEDFSKLGLIRFDNAKGLRDWGCLTCSYIWLWLLAHASDDPMLWGWNFKYYQEAQSSEGPSVPPGCQFWQHFEEFVGRIRVLKSQVFDQDQHVYLEDIHHGARHNFSGVKIINKALSLEKATAWTSTKSTDGVSAVQCERGSIQLANATHCIVNRSGAPYGDTFCPVYTENSHKFCIESHQCKLVKRSTTINEKLFTEEYEKAAEPGTDVFILFTSATCAFTALPPKSAVVDRNVWNAYFGAFAGRAFIYAQEDPPDINEACYSVLTAITGIGTKRADVIMEERKKRRFADIEDCFVRTKVPKTTLAKFRFEDRL